MWPFNRKKKEQKRSEVPLRPRRSNDGGFDPIYYGSSVYDGSSDSSSSDGGSSSSDCGSSGSSDGGGSCGGSN